MCYWFESATWVDIWYKWWKIFHAKVLKIFDDDEKYCQWLYKSDSLDLRWDFDSDIDIIERVSYEGLEDDEVRRLGSQIFFDN